MQKPPRCPRKAYRHWKGVSGTGGAARAPTQLRPHSISHNAYLAGAVAPTKAAEKGCGASRTVGRVGTHTPLTSPTAWMVGSALPSLPSRITGSQRGSKDRRTVGKPRVGIADQVTDASIGLMGPTNALRFLRVGGKGGLSLTPEYRPQITASTASSGCIEVQAVAR